MAHANETSVITLDGEAFPVKAFTLDQLQIAMGYFRDFDLAVTTYDEKTGEGGPLDPRAVKASSALVSLAVGKPEKEIVASYDELYVAVSVLKEVSGLVPLMVRLAQEIEAAKNSTGTVSTPAL